MEGHGLDAMNAIDGHRSSTLWLWKKKNGGFKIWSGIWKIPKRGEGKEKEHCDQDGLLKSRTKGEA